MICGHPGQSPNFLGRSIGIQDSFWTFRASFWTVHGRMICDCSRTVNIQDDLRTSKIMSWSWDLRASKMICGYTGQFPNLQGDMFKKTFASLESAHIYKNAGWLVDVQDVWMFKMTCRWVGWFVNVDDDLWTFMKTCRWLEWHVCWRWSVDARDDLWMFKMSLRWEGWSVNV